MREIIEDFLKTNPPIEGEGNVTLADVLQIMKAMEKSPANNIKTEEKESEQDDDSKAT